MKQKHLASLLQENMTTVRVVFSDSEFVPYEQAIPQPSPLKAPPVKAPPVKRQPAPWGNESPFIDAYGDVQEGTPFASTRTTKEQKSYVYKVLREDGYKTGDIAVAHTHRGMVLVMVVQVDEHPQIDVDADFDYKWLVQRVDLSLYNRQQEAEKNFQAALLEIERRKHTTRIRNELLEMYGDTEEGKLLLEASIRQLGGGAV